MYVLNLTRNFCNFYDHLSLFLKMGGAFFVSRTELLNWMNEVLQLNYTDLRQASNGAAFCQIIDAIYPGKGF